MATRSALTFRDDDRRRLAAERHLHPGHRVQRRVGVLWLLSPGETRARAGQSGGVSGATAERYVALFRRSGVPGLREFHGVNPTRAREKRRRALEPSSGNVRRTQWARRSNGSGRSPACAGRGPGSARSSTTSRPEVAPDGRDPAAPEPTIEEHNRTQAAFLREPLEPVPVPARAKRRSVLFVDPAHSVRGSFLCRVWCLVRMFVRGSSGRRRYNVLGAGNGITWELTRVSNGTRVSSDTMIALLGRIAVPAPGPTTPVLDNARYQRCAVAERSGIEVLFLPSYSPNPNVVERLWTFTKEKALRGKHDPDFATFVRASDDGPNRIRTDHREALASPMTLTFQTFDNASFLAA